MRFRSLKEFRNIVKTVEGVAAILDRTFANTRASAAGSYKKVGTSSGLCYQDKGLTAGKTYYYKVRAKCLDGGTTFGPYSSIVSAKPIPATPSSPKAVSAGYNSVKVSWAKVSGASGYELVRATSKTGKYTLVKTTTATSYSNTGLTTNKTYYYKVRAYRTVGKTKVYSASYSAAVTAKPVPTAPGRMKAARASSSSVKVSWAKVSGASGYEVARATVKTGKYTTVKTVTSGSAVGYTNTGLKKGTTYYFKLRAYRMVSGKKVYGAFSAIVSAKP